MLTSRRLWHLSPSLATGARRAIGRIPDNAACLLAITRRAPPGVEQHLPEITAPRALVGRGAYVAQSALNAGDGSGSSDTRAAFAAGSAVAVTSQTYGKLSVNIVPFPGADSMAR